MHNNNKKEKLMERDIGVDEGRLILAARIERYRRFVISIVLLFLLMR